MTFTDCSDKAIAQKEDISNNTMEDVRGKSKSSWQVWDRCLCGYDSDEVPPQFRELFIISGYRKPYTSATDCIKSLFYPSYESINVWSHFIPLLLFSIRFAVLFSSFSSLDSFVYPLISFAIGICGFLLMSCGAHCFNSMSPRVRHICFFFDYAAISVYCVGAGQSFFFYTRPTNTAVQLFNSSCLFLTVSVLISVMSTYTCCASRYRWAKFKYVVRTGSFVIAFFFNTSPYLYRLLTDAEFEADSAAATYFKRHCVFYLMAALLNMSRIPERLMPGRFDIVGHSHHFLHLFTALGAADQFTAIHIEMQSRKDVLQDSNILPTFTNSLGLMIIVLFIDVGIVAFFGKSLKSDKEEEHKSM